MPINKSAFMKSLLLGIFSLKMYPLKTCMCPLHFYMLHSIGVGFAHTPANSQAYDLRRKELLRLLETCFSHIMYLRAPSGGSATQAAISKTGRMASLDSNIETNEHEQVHFRKSFRQG